MDMIKFPSISKYADVVGNVKHHFQYQGKDADGEHVMDRNAPLPKMRFTGHVKLHGSNASVVKYAADSTEFVPQSRERILSIQSDNYGFAFYMKEYVGDDVVGEMFNYVEQRCKDLHIKPVYPLTIYGEWCGKGIQKNVAIANCDKMFVIFGVRMGIEEDAGGHPIGWFNMSKLPDIAQSNVRVYSIGEFGGFEVEVDFANPAETSDQLEAYTKDVENLCPVGKWFGFDGIGEGIVWQPSGDEGSCFANPRYWFKVKGEKHKENTKRKETAVDIERLNSIQEIVNEFLNEARLERGISFLNEAGHALDKKSTGHFVKFVVADIQKDAAADLVSAELEPKDISSCASKKVSKWYMAHIEALVMA